VLPVPAPAPETATSAPAMIAISPATLLLVRVVEFIVSLLLSAAVCRGSIATLRAVA
jgi:hypothetical protein